MGSRTIAVKIGQKVAHYFHIPASTSGGEILGCPPYTHTDVIITVLKLLPNSSTGFGCFIKQSICGFGDNKG